MSTIRESGSDREANTLRKVEEYYQDHLEAATAIWPDVARALGRHYREARGSDLDTAGPAELALAAIGGDLSILKQKGFGRDAGPRAALASGLPICTGDRLAFDRAALYAKHFYNDTQRLTLDRPDAGFAFLTALGLEDTGFRVKHGDLRFALARELEAFAARISSYES
jgi:hypothetical protein